MFLTFSSPSSSVLVDDDLDLIYFDLHNNAAHFLYSDT